MRALGLAGYLKTAAMTAGVVWDSPLFLIDFALRVLRVLVLLGLWRSILGAGESAAGVSLAAVLTYTVIAEVFSEQLAVRTTLPEAFWEGTLVMRFLRPMGLIRQLSAEMLGRWFIHFTFFSVPLFLLAPLLGVDPRPASAVNGALFALSLALSVLVGLAMEQLFGAATVAFEQPVWIVDYVRTAVSTVLSGSLLPLALYPWGLGDIFSYLPFAAMAWAPLAIFTGVGQPLPLLVSQLIWLAILWPLGTWLWNANREKLISYGG
ncbi:MAG TPA: ABC-2 family transporter protein [Chloroflexota bacterium]|nr:ABC-2 family transporter protein [Chloroflexota bacterium]